MAKTVTIKPAQKERKSTLSRGVLSYHDVLDQPKGKYLVIIDTGPVQSLLFAADDIVVNKEYVTLIGSHENTIAKFHGALAWYAVASEYADVLTHEEMLRRTTDDRKALKELSKELQPGLEEEEEAATQSLLEAVKTGQYL